MLPRVECENQDWQLEETCSSWILLVLYQSGAGGAQSASDRSQISMSITIRLDLPDALAKEAQGSGLLDSASMTELISTELRRRKTAADLNKVLDDLRAQPGEPMTLDEIQAEVQTVRATRSAREASH
jgi:hypothetical protein